MWIIQQPLNEFSRLPAAGANVRKAGEVSCLARLARDAAPGVDGLANSAVAPFVSPHPGSLARIIHGASTAAADLGFLPGVLGPRPLRHGVQGRLGFSALRVPVIWPNYASLL